MSADWVGQHGRDGFAVVRGVVAEAELSRLGAGVERAVGESGESHALRNLLGRVVETRCLASSLAGLAEEALGGPAFVIRGLYFDKTAEANWLVPWHQDLTIAVSERRDAAGFGPWSVKAGVAHVQPPEPWLSRRFAIRVHLDDCGEENGLLRVIPGTHRMGRLYADEIDGLRRERTEYAVTAERGDALVMSPMLLHASSAALNPGHRRVIHLEYAADALPAGLEWHERDFRQDLQD